MGAELDVNEQPKAKLIGTAKVAEMLDLHPVTIRKIAKDKKSKLKPVKGVGRFLKFRLCDVEAYIKAS